MNQFVYCLSQVPDFNTLLFTGEATDLITNLNKTVCTTSNNQK